VFSLKRRQGEVGKAQCESILVGGDDGTVAHWDLNMSFKEEQNFKKCQSLKKRSSKTCKLTVEKISIFRTTIFQHKVGRHQQRKTKKY
jgi:hypothetical protein